MPSSNSITTTGGANRGGSNATLSAAAAATIVMTRNEVVSTSIRAPARYLPAAEDGTAIVAGWERRSLRNPPQRAKISE
jgi:hypothetical protein